MLYYSGTIVSPYIIEPSYFVWQFFQKFREVLSQAEDKNHESRINKEKNNRLIPFDSPTCSNK